MKKSIILFCVALGMVSSGVVRADERVVALTEFAKYHRLITGREPDAAALRQVVERDSSGYKESGWYDNQVSRDIFGR